MLETAFWEAVVALTSERKSATRPPPTHVSEALEALAFDALFAAAALPAVEGGAASPLTAAVRPRTLAAARALGRLSQLRFEAVTGRLLHELECRLRVDTPAARAEVTELAGALTHLHLPVRAF